MSRIQVSEVVRYLYLFRLCLLSIRDCAQVSSSLCAQDPYLQEGSSISSYLSRSCDFRQGLCTEEDLQTCYRAIYETPRIKRTKRLSMPRLKLFKPSQLDCANRYCNRQEVCQRCPSTTIKTRRASVFLCWLRSKASVFVPE